jgi:hypothetical protein
MPPTPKPPGQRRRRNLSQPQWRQLPARGSDKAAPRLPAKDPNWLKSTRDWWKTIWASPMAAAWLEADVDALFRLARMRDLEAQGKLPATGYPAMQQLEDRFGLSPKARRQLQWEVSQAEQAEQASVVPLRAVG